LKLILNDKQLALIEEIKAPFDPEKDYTGDDLIELEDFISDYALYHEQCDEGITEKGNDLIDLVSYLAGLENSTPEIV